MHVFFFFFSIKVAQEVFLLPLIQPKALLCSQHHAPQLVKEFSLWAVTILLFRRFLKTPVTCCLFISLYMLLFTVFFSYVNFYFESLCWLIFPFTARKNVESFNYACAYYAWDILKQTTSDSFLCCLVLPGIAPMKFFL